MDREVLKMESITFTNFTDFETWVGSFGAVSLDAFFTSHPFYYRESLLMYEVWGQVGGRSMDFRLIFSIDTEGKATFDNDYKPLMNQ